MGSSDEKPVPPTGERLHVDLHRLEWAKGLSEDALTAITNTAEWVEFDPGEAVIEVDSDTTHVYFLITGRMQATLHELLGNVIGKDTCVRGSGFHVAPAYFNGVEFITANGAIAYFSFAFLDVEIPAPVFPYHRDSEGYFL